MMQQTPLLTLIIPLCSPEDAGVSGLNGLLSQLPVNAEFLLVDTSHDGEVREQILSQFHAHAQVRCLSLPGGSRGCAINAAMDQARGEFFFCCPATTVVSANFLSELEQAYRLNPAITLYCFNTELSDAEAVPQQVIQHREQGYLPSRRVLSALLRSDSYSSSLWNFALHRRVVERHQLRCEAPLDDEFRFPLMAYLMAGSAYVSPGSHSRQPLIRPAEAARVDDNAMRQRYEAFLQALNLLAGHVQDRREAQILRRLYLLCFFRQMIHLSLLSGKPLPACIRDAIGYFGKKVASGTAQDWLLLHQPVLYRQWIKMRTVISA